MALGPAPTVPLATPLTERLDCRDGSSLTIYPPGKVVNFVDDDGKRTGGGTVPTGHVYVVARDPQSNVIGAGLLGAPRGFQLSVPEQPTARGLDDTRRRQRMLAYARQLAAEDAAEDESGLWQLVVDAIQEWWGEDAGLGDRQIRRRITGAGYALKDPDLTEQQIAALPPDDRRKYRDKLRRRAARAKAAAGG